MLDALVQPAQADQTDQDGARQNAESDSKVSRHHFIPIEPAGRNTTMLRTTDVASGSAIPVNASGVEPVTLDISMATAGAAIERRPRTATPVEVTGEPENR
jgi:hypothetical protein